MQFFCLIALLIAIALLGGCKSTDSNSSSKSGESLAPFSYKDWAKVLSTVVTPDGYVQWDLMQSDKDEVQESLHLFVQTLEKISPDNRPDLFATENDRIAYWINAYNALAMNTVDRTPLLANEESLGTYKLMVGGRTMTLPEIAETKLAISAHPRLYFVLNGCAKSSPPLRQAPYDGAVLDAQLQDQTNIFLRDPRAISRMMDTAVVSDLIMKHADEFVAAANQTGKHVSGILEVLQRMAPDDSPIKGAKSIATSSFDWSLNRPPR